MNLNNNNNNNNLSYNLCYIDKYYYSILLLKINKN